MINGQFQTHSFFLFITGYLFVAGITSLFWPLLGIGPDHPEFRAQSLAFRFGAHAREVILSAAYIIAGVGLSLHRDWGRKLALVVLVVDAFYGSNSFAWGFSSGPPTRRVRLISRIVVFAWNGIWFYLAYRLTL